MLENIEFCYITDILNFYEKNLICSKTQFYLAGKITRRCAKHFKSNVLQLILVLGKDIKIHFVGMQGQNKKNLF